MLHFEFPSLGQGAGVGTGPSFTPKGLRYSHHFRLSLCGHQVRAVWANSCAHVGTHPGGGHRHTSANTGTWVGTQESRQEAMETCKQTWEHTWEGTQGHTRGQRIMQECMGTQLGSCGGGNTSTRGVCTHRHMSTNTSTQVGIQVGGHKRKDGHNGWVLRRVGTGTQVGTHGQEGSRIHMHTWASGWANRGTHLGPQIRWDMQVDRHRHTHAYVLVVKQAQGRVCKHTFPHTGVQIQVYILSHLHIHTRPLVQSLMHSHTNTPAQLCRRV